MKKRLIFLLPVALIVFVLALVLLPRPAEMSLEERMKQDVAANHETLSFLLESNPGQYIKKDHPSFKSFASQCERGEYGEHHHPSASSCRHHSGL